VVKDKRKNRRITVRHRWSTIVLRGVVEGPTCHGEVMRPRKNAATIMVANPRLGTDKIHRSPRIQRRTHEEKSGWLPAELEVNSLFT
jgi:hypothetical protein